MSHFAFSCKFKPVYPNNQLALNGFLMKNTDLLHDDLIFELNQNTIIVGMARQKVCNV